MIDIDKLEALAKAALSRGEEDCESLDDWLSADEFMSSMLLHPIDARFAEAMTPATILALTAEVRALREDAERWRTEMKLRNDPTVAIMFAGTNNRCSIYRGGDLIASDHTYAEAIDAARGAK